MRGEPGHDDITGSEAHHLDVLQLGFGHDTTVWSAPFRTRRPRRGSGASRSTPVTSPTAPLSPVASRTGASGTAGCSDVLNTLASSVWRALRSAASRSSRALASAKLHMCATDLHSSSSANQPDTLNPRGVSLSRCQPPFSWLATTYIVGCLLLVDGL